MTPEKALEPEEQPPPSSLSAAEQRALDEVMQKLGTTGTGFDTSHPVRTPPTKTAKTDAPPLSRIRPAAKP